MKTRVVPLQFASVEDKEFHRILDALKEIYREEVEFLDPVSVGAVSYTHLMYSFSR